MQAYLFSQYLVCYIFILSCLFEIKLILAKSIDEFETTKCSFMPVNTITL